MTDHYQEWLHARSRHLSILAGIISVIRELVNRGDLPDDPSLSRLFDKLNEMDRELAPLEERIRAAARDQEPAESRPWASPHAEGSDAELRSMFPRSL